MTPAEAARQRSRKGEGEHLRAEILEAAEALVLESGDADAVSMRAIAKRVGVTPAALYLHFPDKATLLWEVCAERFEQFAAVIKAAFRSEDDPVEALKAGGRAYVRFGFEQPEVYRVLFELKPEFIAADIIESAPATSDAFEMLVAAMKRCVDSGAFRPVDPFVAALVVWTGLHGFVTAYKATADLGVIPWPDVDVVLDEILEVQLRGFGHDPESIGA